MTHIHEVGQKRTEKCRVVSDREIYLTYIASFHTIKVQKLAIYNNEISSYFIEKQRVKQKVRRD